MSPLDRMKNSEPGVPLNKLQVPKEVESTTMKSKSPVQEKVLPAPKPSAGKKKLRVLMFSWEYPPRIVGGISRVIEGLSKSLVKMGVEVHVITTEMPGSPMEEIDEGVFVHRVGIDSPAPNFHTWILLMNHFFAKRAGRLAEEVGPFDIVHVHDWLVLPAGSETRSFLKCKMVSTLHSLEFRRSGEPNSPEAKMIDSFEWWITYDSAIVIVCSGSMKQDTIDRFRTPEGKIWVIPNGIEASKLVRPSIDREATRARFGVTSNERLILFVGRLTHQKGCEYLIRAMPFAAQYDNVKLVVVGDGYQRGELEHIAGQTGVSWRIRFVGFLPDEDVRDLMLSADVMVIPSVYEPFGVVALEALAAGVPVVASDVGGLGEIIKHEYNGILVYPKDPGSISWGVSRVLSDQPNTRRLVQNGRNDVVRKYTWDAVADLTMKAYETALRT